MFPFLQRKSTLAAATLALLAAMVLMQLARRTAPSPKTEEVPSVAAGETSERFARNNSRSAARAAVDDAWTLRWRQLNALAGGPERDRALASLLEELAFNDPSRALAFAEAETDPELRDVLFQSALRGWAKKNPEDALAWVSTQTYLDRGVATAAVFHGAASDPENAVHLATQLSTDDPERAADYGSYLIAALDGAGEFNRAAQFAAEVSEEYRVDLLNAAYAGWADRDPQAALTNLSRLNDPEIRRTAFDAAVSRWADHAPKAAAAYAVDLAPGHERTFALSVALRSWASADPTAAAEWINLLEPSPALDFGIATIAMQPDNAQQPQLALGWAETIADPRLRGRVLASVLNEWAASDPTAARHYAETSLAIPLAERDTVFSAFEPGFKPISLLP